MTLKELEIGDVFYNIKDKSKTLFVVRGSSVFNRGHGSATRVCMNIHIEKCVSKSCRIEIIKVRESKFKEKLKQQPINFI